MRVTFDVPVPMSDGTTLCADVQLPDGDGPFPALLQRVPYDKGAPAIRDGALDTVRAVRRGYAVVTQDCRGRFSSGGAFTPFVHEAGDGVDTLAWIAAQPWSDGRLGMFGRSYSAFLQWQTAARRPPGLLAIAPMFSGARPVRDWFGGGTALEWGFLVYWALRHLAPVVPPERLAELLHEHGPAPEPFGAPLEWLDDWLSDARRCTAWAALDAQCAPVAAVAVPALVIGGWYDVFLRGTVAAAAQSLVVGPWPHGGGNPGVFPEHDFGPAASGAGLTDRQLDWFDRCLSGAPGRGAHWFRGGAGWESGPRFPPPAEPRRWHLTGSGALAGEAGGTGARTLIYDEADPVPTIGGNTFLPGLEVAANAGPRDQRALLDRGDVLAWFGAPLAAPLDVTGDVTCALDTDAAPGTRWVARLVERRTDGRVLLVADGAALTPDGAGVTVAVGPLAWRFAAGSRIGLLLSHTSWPRYRRWVTDDRPPAPRRGVTTVHIGPGSTLTVPVTA
ncbi:CocE/NonD family hydrolase [Dactylosporangium sp. CS-033363]|uniref:CocE/NonD family hydrolase n=1 Tax=Dactylosporangium sp. CS-033363 TaxID=3239935 RepID=UPI003D90EF2E